MNTFLLSTQSPPYGGAVGCTIWYGPKNLTLHFALAVGPGFIFVQLFVLWNTRKPEFQTI